MQIVYIHSYQRTGRFLIVALIKSMPLSLVFTIEPSHGKIKVEL